MLKNTKNGHAFPGLNPNSKPTSLLVIVIMAIAISLVASLALIAFAWPATHTEPHGISVSLMAPESLADKIIESLEKKLPGAFNITTVESVDLARTLVQEGKSDGALIITYNGDPQVIIASLASPPTAFLITTMANGIAGMMAARRGSAPASAFVVDMAPLPWKDPRGVGVGASLLPLFLGGMITGSIALIMVSGSMQQILLGLLAPTFTSAAMVAILQGWLGVLSGNIFLEWIVLSAGIAAVAFAVIGLGAMIGLGGITLVAALMLLLGNPLSGSSAGPAFVPEGWSTIGLSMPPGATSSALRAVEAFDGTGSASGLWTLGVWITSGLALIAIGSMRSSRSKTSANEFNKSAQS